MNAVTLTVRSITPQRLDARTLLPHTLCGQSEAQIAARTLRVGGQTTRLGDWFEVQVKSGNAADESLRLVGDCRHLDFVGHDLRRGQLVVEGNVGDHAGMSMRGGTLFIQGDAGDYLAGPAAGQRSGMSGGQIVVRGDVGTHLGYRLRRGTIVVAGKAAEFAAAEMVAGTIAIGGTVGSQLAIGMRRGTLLLTQPPALPRCGFTEPRQQTPSIQPLLIKSLCRLAGPGTPFALLATGSGGALTRSLGDRAVGGMGEVLWHG